MDEATVASEVPPQPQAFVLRVTAGVHRGAVEIRQRAAQAAVVEPHELHSDEPVASR
jgi:hypothetical protein